MSSIASADRAEADESRAPLVQDREGEPETILDEERQDDVLPYHNAAERDEATAGRSLFSWKPVASEAARSPWLKIALVVFGTFLSTCPVPRMYLVTYPIRQVLLTFVASLVTFPPLRGRRLRPSERMRRIMIAYVGFYVSMYAFFGAADEVHLETSWRSLLWYRIHGGYRVGSLTRLIIAVAGYFLQKAAGLHSTRRIWATYLLCLVWIYADTPTTLFDLARGREHW